MPDSSEFVPDSLLLILSIAAADRSDALSIDHARLKIPAAMAMPTMILSTSAAPCSLLPGGRRTLEVEFGSERAEIHVPTNATYMISGTPDEK